MFDGFCGLHYWNSCNPRDEVFVAGCSLVIDSISLHSYAATCEILPLKIPHVQNMKILAAGSCHPRASPWTTSPKVMVRELPKTKQFQVGESYNNTISGWWFSTFFIFHNIIWDNPSHWLIFFKMVKTTNQIYSNSIYTIIYMHTVSEMQPT